MNSVNQQTQPNEMNQENNFTQQVNQSADFIDVKELMKQLTVEELCQTAEEYFARISNWDFHLSKPFALIDEVSETLSCFAQVLHGLKLLPGMTILDFGSGSCWTSRYLTQLGCQVISLDVSETALKIGQELYQKLPIIGAKPTPQFLHFDGYTVNLPDKSVDRILCFDSFHHIPNPKQVIQEFSRLLKEGGIAGFSEPGPYHSTTPVSQYEMRNYKVIENDINIREIWDFAQQAGFNNIELAIMNSLPLQVSLDDFEEFLKGGETAQRYLDMTHNEMSNRRIFFLYKGESGRIDSRQKSGLLADLTVKCATHQIQEGSDLSVEVTATNIGAATWLSTADTQDIGLVNLGTHLFGEAGELIDFDYSRHLLTDNPPRSLAPQETLNLEIQIPAPPKGKYILEFDLVSEAISWFNLNGSKTVKINLEVC